MTRGNNESNLKSTLVTVVYAAVLAYSLTFWDKMDVNKPLNIAYFVFACLLIFINWFLYAEHQSQKYNEKNLFLFDIAILFVISGTMYASIKDDPGIYWGLMLLAFLLYIIWDITVWLKAVWQKSKSDWLSHLIGDSLTTVVLLVFVFYHYILPREVLPVCYASAILLIICSLATANWFKPFVFRFIKKAQSFIAAIAAKGLTRIFRRSD